MKIDLRISGVMYEELKRHLFPGDGKESVAICLCGLLRSDHGIRLLVHRVIAVPTEDCILRTPTTVHWKTTKLVEALEVASSKRFSILKVHSHPTGCNEFSAIDDNSDREMFTSAFSWIDNVDYHASAVMLPDGSIFGRVVNPTLDFFALNKVLVVGDDIRYFFCQAQTSQIGEFSIRTAQAFGLGTTSLLQNLTVAVIGCSGTGSPTIEQLMRLGFGKIVLVDPDKIEIKNLNRILNSRMSDAFAGRFKVDVLGAYIESCGLGTEVEAYPKNIYDDLSLLRRIAACDLLFACVDSVDGRQLLNALATFYIIPYFDLGVKLIADGKGGIEQIWGTVHYLQPGKSSLMTRGVFTQEDLDAAGLFRADPDKYASLKHEGYVKNVNVESPAVISVNMQISSLALVEFLARIHRFRFDPNSDSAITRVSLTDGYIQKHPDSSTDIYLEKFVGRGDMIPFLNMPEFS
jgi:hypothetical protein